MPPIDGKKKQKKETLGAHWERTQHSKLDQLYRRVEDVSRGLEKRRQSRWVPSRPYIEELDAIAMALKVLDKNRPS